jgi:hypothetical protein
VRYEGGGGEEDDFIDVIKVKELRANQPLKMSKLELEFFQK